MWKYSSEEGFKTVLAHSIQLWIAIVKPHIWIRVKLEIKIFFKKNLNLEQVCKDFRNLGPKWDF